MSGPLLQFITEPIIGPKERRLIRSHVMKGKNAGKPRPSRRKLPPTCLVVRYQDGQEQAVRMKSNKSFSEELHELGSAHVLGIERLLWNDLTLTSFPLHVSIEFQKPLYHGLWAVAKLLYPPQFCSDLNLSKYAWFRYGIEDEAYLHCLLAVSQSFTDCFGGHIQILPAALSHISQAYRLINERLSGPAACSDQAIAVVTLLAIWQLIHRQQTSGLIHHQGLMLMIEMRGGLRRLAEENRALAQKPWR